VFLIIRPVRYLLKEKSNAKHDWPEVWPPYRFRIRRFLFLAARRQSSIKEMAMCLQLRISRCGRAFRSSKGAH
jgi:hypothetical protein